MIDFRKLKHIRKILTAKELLILQISLITISLSALLGGFLFFKNHIQIVPIVGGSYTEALIGAPSHVNPLYAGLNDVDSDITSLVFSSLFKHDKSGKLINDLAQDYATNETGIEYTITIRGDAKWHNGESVKPDDVVYTFNAIKDAQYQSPLRSGFAGVRIEQVDDRTIKFSLTEKYASFLEMLDFGILPEHLWYPITPQSAPLAELNIKPVGSGPYKFKSLAKDKLGAVKLYSLELNQDYYGDGHNIQTVSFKFFPNTQEAISALNSKTVNGIGYVPGELLDSLQYTDKININKIDLLQIATLFLNQSIESPLKDIKVRQALFYAIDKQEIADKLFGITAADAPFHPLLTIDNAQDLEQPSMQDKEKSLKLLRDAGWRPVVISENDLVNEGIDQATTDIGAGNWLKKNKTDGGYEYLTFTITTIDSSQNIIAAEMIKKYWEEVGVKTNINTVSAQAMQNTLKTKGFTVLLHSMSLNFDQDPFAFWHSSQISETGLNIAGYSNKTTDALIQKARATSDTTEKQSSYTEFSKQIQSEIPAIFLYYPQYYYIQTKDVRGMGVKAISLPYNRFSNINEWYISTGSKFSW